MTERARAALGSEAIEAVADRGYNSGEEILACEKAGITVYLPKASRTSFMLPRLPIPRCGRCQGTKVARDL
jgi:hypothetical protein